MVKGRSTFEKIKVLLKSVKALGQDYFELTFSRPVAFHFTAGQRIRFIDGELERDYTLISAPAESQLAIYVHRVARGRFSPVLTQAKVGQHFTISGPHGHFGFHPSPRNPVFIATGTGLAPFVAFARNGVSGFTLLQEVRDRSRIHYRELLDKSVGKYIVCLSYEEISTAKPHEFFQGTVGEYLFRKFSPGIYDFYACGRSDMIREITGIIDERFPDSRLFYEIFY